jgi:hypothetical protein
MPAVCLLITVWDGDPRGRSDCIHCMTLVLLIIMRRLCKVGLEEEEGEKGEEREREGE